jgi:hypothetical protein
MQIKKVGVVAMGALATVAIMGAPVDAAPAPEGDATAKATVLGVSGDGVHGSAAGRTGLVPAYGEQGDVRRDGWPAPWDAGRFGVAATGNGTAALTGTWQACGATALFGGAATVPTESSPNTVIGDCTNAGVKLDQASVSALAWEANNSTINSLPWQACGSTMSAGVGIGLAESSNTLIGSCTNADVVIR